MSKADVFDEYFGDKLQTKGFQLTFPNGAILGFWHPIKKGQKSYDLMIGNGKDNCFYKVGTIKDIDTLRSMLNDMENN